MGRGRGEWGRGEREGPSQRARVQVSGNCFSISSLHRKTCTCINGRLLFNPEYVHVQCMWIPAQREQL